ncbi:hypothetical protein BGX33_012366 [Mortierella sp. NVP41]|nr:hypothetical protein BGX33_012366 [Mortierella sp. NVP41]
MDAIAIIDLVPPMMSDDARKNYRSITAFYRHDINRTDPPEGAVAGSGFVRHHVEEKCTKLVDYSGRAQFHIVDTQSQGVEDELFVTCDGVTIEVYGVYPKWKHLRSILLNPARNESDITAANANQALLHLLRGRFLVIKDPDATCVSTWYIEQGSRVSSFTHLNSDQIFAVSKISTMSKDGRRIAIPGQRNVDVFLTATWTLLGTYVFQDIKPTDRIGNVRFIRNDTQIIVSTASEGFRFYRNNRGFILNIETMSVVERYISVGSSSFWLATDHPTSPEVLYFRDSQISLFNLENRTVQSPFKLRERCDRFCTSLASPEAQSTTETTSPSGLDLNHELSPTFVDINGRRENLYFVTVTISEKNGPPIRRMSIPLLKSKTLSSATFVGHGSHLVVALNNLMMVWSTPTPLQGFTLRMVHAPKYDVALEICPHRQLYGIGTGQGVVRGRYLDDPLRNFQPQFLDGILYLVEAFGHAGDDIKQDIIQYVGKYINCYLKNNNLGDNIVSHICSNWLPETHESFLQFMEALLAHRPVRWIPKHSMEPFNNPIQIILDKAEKKPRAFEIAEILIDHCINRARHDEDPYFLLPIRQCLHRLTDPNKPYADFTLKLFRSLAYFLARGRNFIVGRHSIAHPYEFRLQFWKPNPRGLHQNKNQVLHLTVEPAANPPTSKFTRNFYLATFDMLWRKTGTKSSTFSSNPYEPETNSETKGFFSWPYAIAHMILRKCRLTHNTFIECHDFDLKTLDNPAIEALLKYKWNTIGLKYWLFRFVAQCFFYALVITGVFIQIYWKDEKQLLFGVFIAITAYSLVFLWLEFIQFLRNKHDYIRSIYNWIDIAVFSLPLFGSLRELLLPDWHDQNPFLSLSILFVFLHVLFELRVIRMVCQFSSIIMQALVSIRVFVFVFFGGLAAFTIAILHFCVNTPDCPSYNEGFSANLFRSFSMAYFMMGGRYDPVRNGFNTDNVGFHLMMGLYFFFSVILMLNVLIALLNNAFDDGDQKWRLEWLENRLHYIERAENFTYDIPGFRAAHDYFPETIYYTATPLQVRNYEKESQKISEDTAPNPIPQVKGSQDQQPKLDVSHTNEALMGVIKQFQSEQKIREEKQKRRDEKHEQMIAQLMNEVRELKGQPQQ